MNKIVVIGGPTTSGKTDYAVELALETNAEVVNVDSQQVYQEIPILTAQPTEEEKKGIPHHLFGYKSLDENHSVGIWLDEVKPVIESIWQKNKLPIIVGGSGMYINALVNGISEIPDVKEETKALARKKIESGFLAEMYEEICKADENVKEKITPNDYQRISRAYEVLNETGKPISFFQNLPKQKLFSDAEFICMKIIKPREILYDKCNKRFKKMWENGILDEGKEVLKKNYNPLAFLKAHGLPQVIAYLNGEMKAEEAISEGQKITRNYVKRQLTWFRHQSPDFYENLSVQELKQKIF